jgi:hypothetical protein
MLELNKHTGERTYWDTEGFVKRIKSLGLNIKTVREAIARSPEYYYESDHAWFQNA